MNRDIGGSTGRAAFPGPLFSAQPAWRGYILVLQTPELAGSRALDPLGCG